LKIVLGRDAIDDAIAMADRTYERWKNRSGHYPNLYNSHLKGKLGEVATEALLSLLGAQHISRFRNAKEQGLCDVETIGPKCNRRIEVKTWSLEHWPDQGRCVKVEQVAKLKSSVDALLWWVVDLPNVKQASDLAGVESLTLQLMGWSTVADVESTIPRETGWRKILNYQVDEANLRTIETLLS
jgi:hypothetical protein